MIAVDGSEQSKDSFLVDDMFVDGLIILYLLLLVSNRTAWKWPFI